MFFVDYNHYCTLGNVDDLMNLQPLEQKFVSFGWNVINEKNGNDVLQLIEDVKKLEKTSDKPKCIIANTIKGHGVPTWEKKHAHHLAGKELNEGIQEGRKILENA